MYGPSARIRVEQEAERRNSGSVVISTVLSLLVVVAAVAVVAYLVLRTPDTAVDSAERLEPIGTALPAPTEQPALPTAVPTEEPEEPEPEPTALGFTGEQPAAAGLPTVPAPEEPVELAGPTPTPRVIAQPTEVPPTPLPPAPTLPPSVPVTAVPVVALDPVETAPPPAPTSAPAELQAVTQPTPTPGPADDDPFNIFDEDNVPRIVPGQGDPMERVRAMQEERENGSRSVTPAFPGGTAPDTDDEDLVPEVDVADLMPTIEVPIVASRNDPFEVTMPDVDVMIEEITARATDPNRNPNTGNAGRRVTERARGDGDDNTGDSGRNRQRKTASEIIQERTGRDNTSSGRSNANPVPIVPGVPRPGGGQNANDDCNIGDPGFPFC